MARLSYLKKQRRTDVTQQEMDEADNIRRRLISIANKRGYGVRYYTDDSGRQMASIGRTDGQGVGFRITAQQAHEWLQTTNKK